MTDTNTAEREALMDLIDAYAEARHVGGCHTYNAKTAEARAKVVASLAASAGSEPLTDSYVQMVPDKCDRIVWRNHYYHLPLNSATNPSPTEGMVGLPTRNELALQLLVAGGFVTEKKLAEALALVDAACPALAPPLPASAKEL